MKKWLPYAAIVLVVIIIIQSAVIVWGSPVNWFNNWSLSSNTDVQELQGRINELEDQLEEAPKEQNSTEVNNEQNSTEVNSGTQKTTTTSKPISSGTLVIQNVVNDVTTSGAKVTWTTTLPARSQFIFTATNQGLDSRNGIGTSHEVYFTPPAKGEIANYHIVAKTLDGKYSDDYYGQYTAVGPHVAFWANTGECGAIYIEDYKHNILANYAVSMTVKHHFKGYSETYTNQVVTDSNGKIAGGYVGCGYITTVYLSGKNLSVTLYPKNY